MILRFLAALLLLTSTASAQVTDFSRYPTPTMKSITLPGTNMGSSGAIDGFSVGGSPISTLFDAKGFRVLNNTALVSAPVAWGRVIREGFATAGDGGWAVYVYSPTTCTAPDGGAQVPATAGGCWNVDLASVGYEVKPEMFGTYNSAPTADNSVMIQKAMDTCANVLLYREYYITKPITSKAACTGQRIAGRNRVTTGFVVDGSFDMTKAGVLILQPGNSAEMTDFHINAGQPVTGTIAGLVPYPPLVFAQGASRFSMRRLLLTSCLTCVDMRGNAGGAYLDDIQLSAYKVGFDIDGALDTLRFNRIHGYVFYINNTALQDANVVWFNVGRADDFKVSDSLTFAGTAFNYYLSASQTTPYNNNGGGGATGSVMNHDSDIEQKGVTCSGGANMSYVGGYFATVQAIIVTGACRLRFANMIIPGLVNSVLVAHPAANVTLTGNEFQFNGSQDVTGINLSSGILNIQGGTFTFSAAGTPAYSVPKVLASAGRLMMQGVQVGDRGAGTGTTLVRLQSDDYHLVLGNVAAGWVVDKPATTTSALISSNAGLGTITH